MPNTYLTVPFKDKDAAKALGARWDGVHRQWYVPDGRELAPFIAWLPASSSAESSAPHTALEPYSAVGKALTVRKKGVSLSQLLAGVSQAVAQAYKVGVWTMVEVVELRVSSGHVFIGVSERDSHGAVLAKTSAVIWQSTANTILPEFERATGAQLAAGIKLLVRARPVFKPQHGFSLEINAIDSEYTLGDRFQGSCAQRRAFAWGCPTLWGLQGRKITVRASELGCPTLWSDGHRCGHNSQ